MIKDAAQNLGHKTEKKDIVSTMLCFYHNVLVLKTSYCAL